MNRPSLTSFVVFSFLSLGNVFGQYGPPSGYYSSATGSGATLKANLHNIIDNHTKLPYSSSNTDVWDALEFLDEDPSNSNNILTIYANRSIPKSAKDGYGTGAAYEWNREHSFPKSLGFDNRSWPAYTDLHHLFAAQDNVNSSRGNKAYDTGGSNNYQALGTGLWNKADSNSWEAWDGVKGDLARAMFYMAVRYNGDTSNEPDLEITDLVSSAVTGSKLMAKLDALLQWHNDDPVDNRERWRNHAIYSNYQGNRNPFVDNPSWVTSIWGSGSSGGGGGGSPFLTIYRVLPNPSGTDTYAEKFEIRNTGSGTAYLSSYRMRDNSNNTNWATFTGTINAGQTRQFTRTSSSDLILTNSSDTLRLETSGGSYLDHVSWTSASSGAWVY